MEEKTTAWIGVQVRLELQERAQGSLNTNRGTASCLTEIRVKLVSDMKHKGETCSSRIMRKR